MEDKLKMKAYATKGIKIVEIELHRKILEKVTNEYNNFIKELAKEKPEVILENAYEKVCKEEMVYVFGKQVLSIEECKALLKHPNILDECYDDWLKSEGNLNEILEYSVDDTIEDVVEHFKNKVKNKDKNAR